MNTTHWFTLTDPAFGVIRVSTPYNNHRELFLAAIGSSAKHFASEYDNTEWTQRDRSRYSTIMTITVEEQ